MNIREQSTHLSREEIRKTLVGLGYDKAELEYFIEKEFREQIYRGKGQ